MENKHILTVKITKDQVKVLKEYAKKNGFVFSTFIQNIIVRAIDQIEGKGCKAE